MRLLVGIITASLITMTGVYHACSIPPQYLPSEYGSDNIKLGNVVKRADKIILGKYIKINNSDDYIFNVSKSLKPDRKIFFKRKEKISFTNVKQKYLYEGVDDNPFVSTDDLFHFINSLKSNSQNYSKLQYGVGGVLSGISHGSDCERFVMMFDGQQYLTFLDAKNVAIAQFGVGSANVMNVKALLSKIDSTLNEHAP